MDVKGPPMENWKQFTLQAPECRNAFQPLHVLHTFLSEWLGNSPEIITWHVLFEPSALIRFVAAEPQKVLMRAERIALRYGLEFFIGDTSFDLNPGLAYPGEDYHGESEFYGDDLWRANYKFMQAMGELSIQIAKLSHEKQVFMMGKFAHLYANILGLNYLEESSFFRIRSERALELYKTHGRS